MHSVWFSVLGRNRKRMINGWESLRPDFTIHYVQTGMINMGTFISEKKKLQGESAVGSMSSWFTSHRHLVGDCGSRMLE